MATKRDTPSEPDVEQQEAAPPPLVRDELGVHARAIWDNTAALTKEQIAGMYGGDASQTKDEMVQAVVRRYLDTRPDQATRENA